MTAPEIDWVSSVLSVDAAFIEAAVSWMRHSEEAFVSYVWAGYDRMSQQRPAIDGRDLERSITQLLEGVIRDEMSGDEPYFLQHSPFERETMQPPPAQPPAYDLAFVFRADPRVMWPLEAKVLLTPGSLADYVRDVRDQYLTCRYAPFSPSGGMLGYLLQGSAESALHNIATQLHCTLAPLTAFAPRPCAVSTHSRTVPVGKPYPAAFDCHHVVLAFKGLRRKSVKERSTEVDQ